MKRTTISNTLQNETVGSKILIKGWVRTKRAGKSVSFIAVNDGSTIHNLQVVATPDLFNEKVWKEMNTGACIAVSGILTSSLGAGQKIELNAESIEILGTADPEKYPLQPKKHSLEFLREIGHLRFRTNTIAAVMRIRHALTFSIHNYFNDKGFYSLHTPIITSSDAEGAGEIFQVSTLDSKNLPLNDDNNIDYTQDFFGKKTNLTVSGQLEGELGAMALGAIYTFGPTFRAENSNTSRHLAEFWMIEPEVAFNTILENMDLAEDFMKYQIKYVLKNCKDDLDFLHKRELDEEKTLPKEHRNELPLLERLNFIINNDFERITYTEAIQILLNSKPYKKKKFKYDVSWGIDLQSEHERFLVEKHFKKPVIIIDYPKEIKAFYMKQNDDNKTVAAMDVLFPGIGEIIGGSERESDYDKLKNRMEEMNIPEKELWWYLDTRKFGTAPHAGFGLGFERLILFVTGMKNIRDVIPFPRTPKSAEF